MTSVEPIAPYLEPLRRSVRVERAPGEAFRIFTAGMGRWWPLRTHSLAQERAVTCAIDPAPGGSVYEVDADGRRQVWGTVRVWEPPHRFVMSWHPGRDAATAQEVEVRFLPDGAGTLVELEHRQWQTLGPAAEETRRGYETGWDGLLNGNFAPACR